MKNSSSFLYLLTYFAFMVATAKIAAIICYLSILLMTTVPQLLITITGAGLVAFAGVVLFYLVKFIADSPTKDGVIRAIVLSAGLMLAGICGVAGVWMIITLPFVVALIAGLGIILFVVIVLFFFIRLLRIPSKKNNPFSIEITKAEHPKLFKFIKREIKTHFVLLPKRIFLSPDANMSVFRKRRLEIGLGLVNNINISEFQALLLREVVYFRGLKMEDKPAPAWAGIFKFCATLAAGMYKIFQHFLYQPGITLDRNLAFYADGIAVRYAGSNNLLSALSKKEMAAAAYTAALSPAAHFMKEKKVSRNIYNDQLTVLRSFTEEYHVLHSRVNYKISIPTLEERIQRIEKDSIKRDSVEEDFITPNETSAWTLFNNPKELQETLTANIYKQVYPGKDVRFYEEEEFETWYSNNPYKMPAAYKGFYSNRYLDIIDWDLVSIASQQTDLTFEQLFTEENGQLQATIIRDEKEIIILRSIKEKRIAFDFKGKRFSWQDADQLIAKIEVVIADIKVKQSEMDKKAFAFLYQQSDKVMGLYQQYQSLQQEQRTFIETADKIRALINTFDSSKLSEEVIRISLDQLDVYEKVIKPEVDYMTYYSEKGFHEEELYALRGILANKPLLLQERQNQYYRTLVEHQLNIYESAR